MINTTAKVSTATIQNNTKKEQVKKDNNKSSNNDVNDKRNVNTVNLGENKKGKADSIKSFKDPVDNAVTFYSIVASQSKTVSSAGKFLGVSANTGRIGSAVGSSLVRLSNGFTQSNNFNEVTQRNILARTSKIAKNSKNVKLARNIANLGSEKHQRNIIAGAAKIIKVKVGKDSAKIVIAVGKVLSSGIGSKAVKNAPKVISTLSRGVRVASFIGRVSPGVGFVSGVVSTGLAVNDARNAKSWQGKVIHSTRAVVNSVGAVSSFVPGIGAVVGIGSAGIDIGLGFLGKRFK